MSRIASEFFSQSPVLLLPLIALFLFLAVFIAVSLRAARMTKSTVDTLAQLPLSDGEPRPATGEEADHG